MSNLSLGAAVLGVLMLAGIAGNADYADAVLAERAYCANVTLYHASAGEQGWPDYNSNYSEICKENQNS
jgi:hypothetical protein